MPKHDLDDHHSQTDANKRVRFDASHLDQQSASLADHLATTPSGQHSAVAWSRLNLLAKLIHPPTSAPSSEVPRIALSLLPLSSPNQRKADQSSSSSIPLALAPDEVAQSISFSPAGAHLLLVASGPTKLRLVLYQMAASGCINEWAMACEWLLDLHQAYTPALSGLHWLSADRPVKINELDGSVMRAKPSGCSTHRAGGQAFAAVLNSNELIVARFSSVDASSNPSLLRLPLNNSASPLNTSSPGNGESTSNAFLARASSVTDNIPPASGPMLEPATALGLSMGLPAESSMHKLSRERVSHASLVSLPNEPSFLVATRTHTLPSAPVPPTTVPKASISSDPQPAPVQQQPPPDLNTEMSLDDELMLAFGAAPSTDTFSSSHQGPQQQQQSPSGGSGAESRSSCDATPPFCEDERHSEVAIALSKVSVRWQPQSMAFELSAQQIGPVHYVHESYPAHDRLLAMSWSDPSFSEQVQLVTASSDQEHKSTLLQAFTVSPQKGALSEAFAKMECRKADVREGPVTWTSKLASHRMQEGLVTCLEPGVGHILTLIRKEGRSALAALKILSTSLHVTEPQTLPSHQEVTSLALSPNGSLLCAFSNSSTHQSQFSLVPDMPSTAEGWGQRLGLSIIKRLDASDIVKCIPRDTRTAAFAQAQSTLTSALPKGSSIEGSKAIAELISVQHMLRLQRPDAAHFTRLLLQLIACVNAFRTSSIQSRGAKGGPMLFHLDSIWPLIGHASFYCESVKSIIQALASHDPNFDSTWPKELLFLLHPASVSLLRQLRHMVDAFHSFIFAFEAPPGTVAVEIARSVFTEMTTSSRSGFKFKEWSDFLEELPKKTEGIVNSQVASGLLAASAIPEDPQEPLSSLLHDLVESVKPLSVKVEEADKTDTTYDVITKARISRSKRVYRKCGRCLSVSELGKVPQATDGFALFCAAWRSRCVCGSASWLGQGQQ